MEWGPYEMQRHSDRSDPQIRSDPWRDRLQLELGQRTVRQARYSQRVRSSRQLDPCENAEPDR